MVPSYQMRRGHPILIARNNWEEILTLEKGQTLRDFFKRAADKIYYVIVSTPTVMSDMDTPADYHRELDRHSGS